MRRHLLTSSLAVALLACATPPSNAPMRRLGNPVTDARNAMARGDSTYVGILGDSLVLPGTSSTPASEADRSVRMFSRRSLGLSAEGWAAQRDSLTVYAAAYNALVEEAREGAGRRAPSPGHGGVR